jgi:hypothetical protein
VLEIDSRDLVLHPKCSTEGGKLAATPGALLGACRQDASQLRLLTTQCGHGVGGWGFVGVQMGFCVQLILAEFSQICVLQQHKFAQIWALQVLPMFDTGKICPSPYLTNLVGNIVQIWHWPKFGWLTISPKFCQPNICQSTG